MLAHLRTHLGICLGSAAQVAVIAQGLGDAVEHVDGLVRDVCHKGGAVSRLLTGGGVAQVVVLCKGNVQGFCNTCLPG